MCPGCEQSIKAPAAAAGRQVRCPKCKTAAHVPGPEPAVSSATDDGDDDLFSGLSRGQALAAPTFAVSPSAAIGTERAGISMSGAAAGAKAALGAAGAVGGVLANPVLMGGLCSAIGAAIGGAIWCAVAYHTHYEVGLLAWAVGALAGLGMRLGFRDVGDFPGIVAAGMAVLGIVGGKFAVFYLILLPALAAVTDVSSHGRQDLADMMARRVVIDAGKVSVDDDEKFESAVEAELPRAEAQVAAMSDTQVSDRLNSLAARLSTDVHAEMRSQFWKIMFGFFDVIFIPLALFTVYRVASGWSSDD